MSNRTFCSVQIIISADILSEEVILKWYKDSHSSRGWSVFMDQMKKFVEWLEHAEEGKSHGTFPGIETVVMIRTLVLKNVVKLREINSTFLATCTGNSLNHNINIK